MKYIKIALVILITLIITGCDQLPMFQPAPTSRPTDDPALPTNTKWVFQTSTPEFIETPTLFIPTFAPVEGLQKIETDDYEIYLPDSYEGGSTDENIDQILENFRKMGGIYNAVADNLEYNPDTYELIATDSNKGPSGFITNIQILSEIALPAYSIEASMSSASAGLPDNFKIVSEKMTVINGYETGQIIVEFDINGVKGKELLYLIKGESSVWQILFATGADEYDERLVEFIQIVDSFRIK